MTERVPDKRSKKPYEQPRLDVYGSVESLTQIGMSGTDEGVGGSGQKKRSSLM